MTFSNWPELAQKLVEAAKTYLENDAPMIRRNLEDVLDQIAAEEKQERNCETCNKVWCCSYKSEPRKICHDFEYWQPKKEK